ncbi:MAG: VWA domain-containing protein [Elusimicrobiales bacterium]
MIFSSPWMLLWLIPALAAMFLSRRVSEDGGAAVSLPMEKGFKPEATWFSVMARFAPRALRAAALVLLALALARPQRVQRGIIPPAQGVDIMLLIDTSASMAALDFDPYNRMEAAKRSAKDFIEKRPGDRIGIVVFATNALLQCPLTLDHDALFEYLNNVDIGITHTDATAIGDAIATASNHLKDSAAKSKVIALLTDGRSNSGIIQDPTLAAKAAASYGIKIYTIGTAAKGQSRVPVQGPMGIQYAVISDDLDEGTLMAIAQATGGEFYRATNYNELKGIYSRIDKLEKVKFSNIVSLSYQDKCEVFLLPALLLLITEFLLSKLAFVRIP